jgi:hypothetical protein
MTMNSNISKSLQDWITFFQHSNDEAAMATVTNPAVKQAYARLKELSADPEFRRIVEARERDLRNDKYPLNDSRPESSANPAQPNHSAPDTGQLSQVKALDMPNAGRPHPGRRI